MHCIHSRWRPASRVGLALVDEVYLTILNYEYSCSRLHRLQKKILRRAENCYLLAKTWRHPSGNVIVWPRNCYLLAKKQYLQAKRAKNPSINHSRLQAHSWPLNHTYNSLCLDRFHCLSSTVTEERTFYDDRRFWPAASVSRGQSTRASTLVCAAWDGCPCVWEIWMNQKRINLCLLVDITNTDWTVWFDFI